MGTTKGEMKKLNKILDKIIKRILMTPEATPREALYIETGLLDIETIIDIKRLNMLARLNNEKSQMMATVLANPECKWMKKTKEVMEKYGIQDHELYGTKPTIQNAILVGIHIKFRANMIKSMEERSKLKYFLDGKIEWKPETPAKYIETLTRKQASLIFKARTRMIKAKGNYKNGFRNQNCRACKNALETHAHILYECEKLHPGTATSMRNGTQNNEGMRPTGHDTLTLTTDHERAIELGRTNYETNTTTVHKKIPITVTLTLPQTARKWTSSVRTLTNLKI